MPESFQQAELQQNEPAPKRTSTGDQHSTGYIVSGGQAGQHALPNQHSTGEQPQPTSNTAEGLAA
jgi:hypothetical protein